MKDTVNAFVDIFTIPGKEGGPLSGLTFGAKDIYDIQGRMTGCGSPDWAASHPIANRTAPAVQALLDAGASLVGKTHTDEIAYSLMGVNAHYGTPINSAAPNRVPGGSSSGSVAAAAAGLVDIGLGSDTGGSVRMPASFCGIYGMRTTHGRIDLSNVMPLAPSFDTCGWFARDPETLAKAGLAYGIDSTTAARPKRLLVAEDALGLVDAETAAWVRTAIKTLSAQFESVDPVSIADGDFLAWRTTFMVCQAAEVWQAHNEWILATKPSFGPGVKQRFEIAASITEEQHAPARAKRLEISKRILDLIGDDGVIVLPTSPGPAPLRDADEASLNDFRMAALDLLSGAGLAGLPQLNMPAGIVDGGPVGLSIVGGRNADAALLAIAQAGPF